MDRSLTRGVVLGVSAFLLASMGGAIFAAPVTIPLLVWAVRASRSAGYRWAATAVLALTAMEVTWALVYVSLGEGRPAIWLLPLLAMAAVLLTAPRWSVAPD